MRPLSFFPLQISIFIVTLRNSMSNFVSFFKVVFVVLVFAGLSFFLFTKYLRDRAVETCLTVGYEEYKNQETGSSSKIPNMKTYTDCMKEKGYLKD